ncbi:hypothetical protein NM208_g11374 [Fusarium decemcellulare]|uniref:Uncharacterized protein n=1 Tax=Fusarium decemcellulare TaxID=57161 RepID=A0ACC1RSU5_9HYPO|nr:hypothetical protein NM208_g11374 [Fusarium decemcellulare]
MKATTILASLVVLGTTMVENVSAQYHCYSVGHTMNPNDLRYHTKRACRGYNGNKGAFQGTFGPNEKKTACVNWGSGHIDMELQNLNPSNSFDLKDEDCESEFDRLINRCGRYGGRVHQPTGWFFRIDPNDGREC